LSTSLRVCFNSQTPTMPTTAPFRAAKLDLGGFINSKIIRDHTKRKVFEKYEPQRYAGRSPS
jgi:hypothetical protein